MSTLDATRRAGATGAALDTLDTLDILVFLEKATTTAPVKFIPQPGAEKCKNATTTAKKGHRKP